MGVPEDSGQTGRINQSSDGPVAESPFSSIAEKVTLIGEPRQRLKPEPGAEPEPPAETPIAQPAETAQSWQPPEDELPPKAAHDEVQTAYETPLAAEAAQSQSGLLREHWRQLADGISRYEAQIVELAHLAADEITGAETEAIALVEKPDTAPGNADALAPEPIAASEGLETNSLQFPESYEAPTENVTSLALERVALELVRRSETEAPPEPQSAAVEQLQSYDYVAERSLAEPQFEAEREPEAELAPEPEPAFQAALTADAVVPPLAAPSPPQELFTADAAVSAASPSIASPTDVAAPAPPKGLVERYRPLVVKSLRYAGFAIAGYAALVIVLIFLYRFINPPTSMLMVYQSITGVDVEQSWVPLEQISPNLVRAVVVSEDNRFCEHWGIDLREISDALERGGRGASTISMQVSKNLFLWSSKSYVRKAVEVPITLMIESFWPKRRIMEIYLNIAEWGPGRFGAEEAARLHFGKSALTLNEREAARLAVALPNPITRDAGDPGPGTLRLASAIQARMRYAPRSVTACLGGGSGQRAVPPSKVQPAAQIPPAANSGNAAKPADTWQPVVKPSRPQPRQEPRPPAKRRNDDSYQGPVIDGWR